MADCLFCQIAAGAVPAVTVRETDRVVAFRDVSPQAPTHVLVIPRDHHPDLAAHEVAASEGIDGSGYRVVFNTGSDGGQTVRHVHAHVLGGRPMRWPPG